VDWVARGREKWVWMLGMIVWMEEDAEDVSTRKV
jgi:hypothetical protein